LILWLNDVIGHVTTLFAVFNFLTALYWNLHQSEVRRFNHLGAIST